MSQQSFAPLIIFAFNRPYHIFKTLESLSQCDSVKKTELIAFIDAPRSPIEKYKVKAVKKIINEFGSYFSSIKINCAKKNKGCDASIRQGLNKVFKIHERAIILEDDIIVGKKFLESMNLSLEKYSDVKNIYHINAYNFQIPGIQKSKNKNKFFLFRSMFCWGWATWKDRWEAWNNDPLAQDVFTLMNTYSKKDKHYFNLDGYCNWWNQVEANATGKLENTWDILWFSFISKQKGLCLTPYYSLVKNIGLDGSGVHCKSSNNFDSHQINNELVNEFPTSIQESHDAVKMIKENLKSKKFKILIKKVKHILKNLILKIRNFLID